MRRLGLVLLASASLLGSTVAFAQTGEETAPKSPESASGSGLTDIVVTAQRREQNLLTVPLSISAKSGDQLINSGIDKLASLKFSTPGFLAQEGSGFTQIFLRGIGNNVFIGTGPSITTYFDDVPRISSAPTNAFADVARVEVLKGAQGGLYGLNSTGGVINVVTRQPGDKLEAEGRVSYGTKNTLHASIYANVPLSDRIAWNFAVTREQHSDYIRNRTRDPAPYTADMFPVNGSPGSLGGTNVNPYGTPAQTAALFNSGIKPPKGSGDQDFWAFDSKLRIQATENLKITFSGDYSRKHDSDGNQWANSSPATAQAGIENVIFPYVAGIYQTGGLCPSGVRCAATDFPAGFVQGAGKFTAATAIDSRAFLVDYGGSAKIEWALPNLTITSISAYRVNKYNYIADVPAVNLSVIEPFDSSDKRNFYQEFRAVSKGSGPFHFLAGANYLSAHLKYTQIITYFNLFVGGPTSSEAKNKDWSIYGQVGYDLTDKLNLTVSGRYVHLRDFAFFTTPPESSNTIVSSKFLPSATLSYNIGGGVLYARYAKGFKEGGVTPTLSPIVYGDSPGSAFKPEGVDTYEIGARGTLLDRKLQYTAAVFYNKYTNLQTTDTGDASHPEIIFAIINAGKARTYGAEASLNYRPIRPLTVGVDLGYLNAKYTKYSFLNSTAGLSSFNFDGRRMIFAPKFQVGMNVDVDQPISDQIHLVGNLLVSHISKFIQQLSEAPIPSLEQPGYWLTNLRVGVQTADSRYGVYLYVNNLFNKFYTTSGSLSSSLGAYQTQGDPRIIGAEVKVKF